MVLDSGQRFTIEVGIADDDAVGSHECDACADQSGQGIGFGIELGAAGRLAM